MIYNEQEIDISTTNYIEGVAIVPLPTGEIVCIPEDRATSEELGIIQQIKNDVAERPIPDPVEVIAEHTIEDYLVDVDYRLSMVELGV